MAMGTRRTAISDEQRTALMRALRRRFEENVGRHPGIAWDAVERKLEAGGGIIRTLWHREQTGGEPDVVGSEAGAGELLFVDCSAESPSGRRSLCYDRAARESRKRNQPGGSALELAEEIGVEILSEEQYRALQTLGAFDTKTSSWILTPARIRELGGALFCDRRYNAVFTYHNGAESYYAARGFRGCLRV